MTRLDDIEIASLTLVKYPDPRLRHPCARVAEFGPSLAALARRMFEVMYQARGVGLAAPQVGMPIRMFVANITQEPEGERVYVNPELIRNEGSQEEEEGCLSFPSISCRIKRYATTTIRAQDLSGKVFEESGDDLQARVYQHEYDHLEGTLLVDRMTAVARLANRRLLKELEADFAE